MAMMQQELKVPPTPGPDGDDMEELYEEEPRRRSWGTVLSVALAVALVFVGYQWHQAAGREQLLASQVRALRADAETLRLRSEEARAQVDGLQTRLTAVSAEKETLAQRVAALEKGTPARVTAARDGSRERATARDATRARATPVAAKKTR